MTAAWMAAALLAQAAERVPAEIHARADLPFAALEALAALPGALLVVDARSAPLSRGKVELLARLGRSVGARVLAPIGADLRRRLRRLDPALLVVDVPRGAPTGDVVADVQAIGAGARRFVFTDPPSGLQLGALRAVRPSSVRCPLPRGPLSWPGGLSVVLDEGAAPAEVRRLREIVPSEIHLAPRGNYLADATLAMLGGLDAPLHSVEISLPLAEVDVAQLRRLSGLRVEVAVTVPPAEADLRILAALLFGGPFPVADAGAPGK
jgi:hypothetical protein